MQPTTSWQTTLPVLLYDMLPADPKTVKPAGEWNTIVIKVKDGKVTHTQNGKKVVQYTLWSKEWDDMVANSKFKDFQGFQEGISHEGVYRLAGSWLSDLVPQYQDSGIEVSYGLNLLI